MLLIDRSSYTDCHVICLVHGQKGNQLIITILPLLISCSPLELIVHREGSGMIVFITPELPYLQSRRILLASNLYVVAYGQAIALHRQFDH